MDVEFESFQDTNRKLQGCIVNYKGIPYFCQGTVNEPATKDFYKVAISPLNGGPRLFVKTTDPDFEARYMPLGYTDIERHAVYLERSPAKRLTLGISNGTVVGTYAGDVLDNRWDISENSCYLNLFYNRYPTYKEALSRLLKDPKKRSISLSRDFACAWADRPYNLRLYYKKQAIGSISCRSKESSSLIYTELYDTPYKSFIMRLIEELNMTQEPHLEIVA